MKDDKQIFVEWLRKAIKIDKLMTGEQLAAAVNISPATISGYLTGRTKGPAELDLRLKICEALNVDYQKIIKEGRMEVNGFTSKVFEEFVEEKLNLAVSAMVEGKGTFAGFNDKEKAETVRSVLVDIEREDAFEFETIIEELELRLRRILLRKKQFVNK